MPVNEDIQRAQQLAELRFDVRHIQSDVTDVKAEVRAVTQHLDALSDSLASAKIWALMLYFALAGSMLLVMARGFKWI